MQDYVMRMIQQVAQMLAAIMGHRNAGRLAEAQEEVEQACLNTAGVPLSLIRQASPEALRGFLQAAAPERLARDILLAELLLQEAEMRANSCDAESAAHYRAHAFCLIHDSVKWLTGEDAAHYHAKLDALAAELSGAQADPHVAPRLKSWTERAGRDRGGMISGSNLPA